MTTYDQCLVFKSWGQNDPNYYRVYVWFGLTEAQFKEITGEDYQSTTTPDSQSTSQSQLTSESTSVSA